jgi:hypothetical protein
MRARTILAAAALLTVGALLGWLTASGRLITALAQEKRLESAPADTGGTPLALPRPDFHFPGNVGRTILDSDKPQFPQPVQPPKGPRTSS